VTEQETRETPADGADTSRTSEGQTGQGNTSPTDALPAGEGPVARRSAHEEFAAEMTPRAEAGAAYPIEERREETGFGLGALALALSVLSLFFAPYLLGAGGVLLGYLAYHQGSRSLGAWAMGLGLVSIVVTFFLGPLIRAW